MPMLGNFGMTGSADAPSAAPAGENFLTRFARGLLEMRRRKLGLVEEERATEQMALDRLVKQAQAARIAQQLQLAPAEQESEIALRGAQARNLEEQGASMAAYRAAQTAAAQARATELSGKRVERSVDLGDRERIFYTDGTSEDVPKGAVPGGHRPAVSLTLPQAVVDRETGEITFAPRGELKPGGRYAPLPTSEQRNTEYQAAAVEPAFDLAQQSLDSLKTATGGVTGTALAAVPGTDAYWAKRRFQDHARALLGAIVARQAGEGSRLSDEDRVAYSQAASIVNNAILLPGGIEEAQNRLNDARSLLEQVRVRRRAVAGFTTNAPAPSGATVDAAEFVRDPVTGKLVRKR